MKITPPLPLPYRVTLKHTPDEDSVPEVHTVTVIAYTLMDAYIAAVVEVSGRGFAVAEEFTVVHIEPDMEKFQSMFLTM